LGVDYKYNELSSTTKFCAKLVDFTLPEGLPTGEYCLYGILLPEDSAVVETLVLDLWVMEQWCFEVF